MSMKVLDIHNKRESLKRRITRSQEEEKWLERLGLTCLEYLCLFPMFKLEIKFGISFNILTALGGV